MHGPVRRSLSVLGVAVAFAVVAAPAQAFTPPIGTDKGSVVAPPHGARDGGVASPGTADGIIAILIG